MSLETLSIAPAVQADIAALAATFEDWHKPPEQFAGYLERSQQGEIAFLVARLDGRAIGYTTLVWQPKYIHFRERGIPEIVDLNVKPPWHGQGIGRAIIAACEELARQRGLPIMGISVEQTEEYARPNRLYPHLGYRPDEFGVSPEDNELHLTKAL